MNCASPEFSTLRHTVAKIAFSTAMTILHPKFDMLNFLMASLNKTWAICFQMNVNKSKSTSASAETQNSSLEFH